MARRLRCAFLNISIIRNRFVSPHKSTQIGDYILNARLGLVIALLLTHIISLNAQDCTEFTDALEYSNRADIASDQRLYDDAVLDFGCAIQLAPDEPYYYNGRGIAYYWLQEDAAANADFAKVLELDPQADYAYNNLANLYANIGDYETALAHYTTSLELSNGNDAITLTNRASLYSNTGDYAAAYADLESAYLVDPNYEDQYLTRAWLFGLDNQVALAAEGYSEWLARTQTDESYPQYIPNRTYVTRLLTGKVEKIIINLNEGDTLSISAAAIDSDQRVDPLMVLFDATGTAAISDDDSGVNLDAVIADYVAPQTGDYVLWLGNAGGYYHEGVDGEVRLSIERKASDGAITVDPTAAPDTVIPTAEPVEVTEVSFSTFRLFTGVIAEVYTTEGDRLNLRGGPGLRFEIIGKLDKGAHVTLIEGPRKQDGLAWWRIRTADGTEGWAVERVDVEQTLQMALIVGEEAVVVTGDESLNVRTGAGRSNEIAFQLEDGQQLTLLEVSSELVDGFQWWKIRLPDGREGWTIDRLEGERMMIPLKEREGGEG